MRAPPYKIIQVYALSHLLMACSLLLDIGETPERGDPDGGRSMSLDQSVIGDGFTDLGGADLIEAKDLGLEDDREFSDQTLEDAMDAQVGGGREVRSMG
jgi:hypothetical protein